MGILGISCYVIYRYASGRHVVVFPRASHPVRQYFLNIRFVPTWHQRKFRISRI